MVHTLETTQNVTFLETGFPIHVDYVVVQYSATNNGPPSNSQIHFQGNILEVNHLFQSMYCVFAPNQSKSWIRRNTCTTEEKNLY
jgi:hypothetical protein